MAKIFKNTEIEGFSNWNSGKTFSDLHFTNVHFIGCSIYNNRLLQLEKNPGRIFQRLRTRLQNVHFINCKSTGSALHGILAEDIVIDSLSTPKYFPYMGNSI
jgi:hypothetical protein